ncbi:ABC transporter permease [Cupriavidus alkaliphilus]|uniref:Peptide/nickel transport system permease protein n=1 Tax=Cupriavidus alkaliphilus TaxID=942866 RepID=A0A7W4VE20_9BURK|nr:ABC transporter permease [Cupriavidus alkaliphilus]MBB3009876.1 peptide/nickel transport system permease protein [Cupriavidus alkaliphilus]
MTGTILRRLMAMAPMLFVLSLLVFGLSRLIPGDPAVVIAGESATPQLVEQIRRDLGLDLPAWQQYAAWLRRVVQGDLGHSLFDGQSVALSVAQRLPVTLLLVGAAMLVSCGVGLAGGILAGAFAGRLPDRIISTAAAVMISVPGFVLGLFLVLVFSIGLKWFPATGFRPPAESFAGFVHALVLPMLALGSAGAGELVIHTRSAVIAALDAQHTAALRSRGLPERTIVLKHALRNAAIPLSTVIGLIFQHLLGASVVVEILFAVPGIGSLAVAAVQNRDIPVVQGVVLALAVLVLLTNLFIDVLYSFLDPRTR